MSRKILILGGAGFIGSAFVRLIAAKGYRAIVVDKLSYAGDTRRLASVKGKYSFYKADICNHRQMELIFDRERPECVVNFAAETHVDRSIKDAKVFLKTNLLGAEILFDISRKQAVKKFVQISTDEVYGDIKRGEFFEDSPLNPSSPYSAAKAAADLLLKSYMRTYNFPAVIVRPSNNYGPWQYPEKLIPLSILKILKDEKVPVYAHGKNVREWLYVDDCAQGIFSILEKGGLGEVYNIGSNQERQNIEVVRALLKLLNKPNSLIEFVKDRPGHDFRYRLNSNKIRLKTRWLPRVDFKEGVSRTVSWYLENKVWLLSKWKDIAWLYKNK